MLSYRPLLKIGITTLLISSKYQAVAALPNPVNDATDIAATLRELGFEVIFRKDVDKKTN